MNVQIERLKRIIQHPYPLLFATLSGAHLYGFPSPDSDYDLRGVHLLPLTELVGMRPGPETWEISEQREDIELDLVTHDLGKFCRLLLNKNGYVLEQIFSPIIVHTTTEHSELKRIARACITKRHAHHYLGFSKGQWKLFQKDSPPRAKPLLYVFRVLLTGIHLMRTGEVEADIIKLNEAFKLGYIDELAAMKKELSENVMLKTDGISVYLKEYERLTRVLEEAMEKSRLPESPGAVDELNDFLIRTRLGTGKPVP